MARATVQRHKSLASCEPAKRGPKGFMSDDALLGEIRAVLGSSVFVGEG
ncbi:MAG: IS3 family transposase, partial [Phycisphaerales bacterium]|nr:IS3 family transposase [Phycisphaerales bacterium]